MNPPRAPLFFASDKYKYGPKGVYAEAARMRLLRKKKAKQQNRSVFGRSRSRRFALDLEPVLHKDVILKERDVDMLMDPNHDAAKVEKMYNKFKWDRWALENTFETGRHKLEIRQYVDRGSYGVAYIGEYSNGSTTKECIVKIVKLENIPGIHANKEQNIKSAILELINHYIVLKTCKESKKIKKGQRAGRMARVPELYAAFTADAFEFDTLGGGNMPVFKTKTCKHIVIAMEKLSQSADGLLLELRKKYHEADTFKKFRGWSDKSKEAVISTALAFLFYQTITLLIELGDRIEFNHRDLHMGNIMIKHDPTKLHGECHNDFFQSYIIDFGWSRVTYKGKVISSKDPYEESWYNPAHDLLYMLWSSKRALDCDMRLLDRCVYLAPVMDYAYDEILDASGLVFSAPENTTGITLAFLCTLQQAGRRLKKKSATPYTPVYTPNINEHKINPETAAKVYARILKQLAARCKGHSRPTEERPRDADQAEIRYILSPR